MADIKGRMAALLEAKTITITLTPSEWETLREAFYDAIYENTEGREGNRNAAMKADRYKSLLLKMDREKTNG